MRRSTVNPGRPPAGPRPSTSSSNMARSYLSAARSAQQSTVPPSPTPSVSSVSQLKRKERDFEARGKPEDDSESNIAVVVRVRGRNSREIAENSGVVLSTPGGLRGKEITLNLGGPLNNKTYTFDRVFPPEADQSMVYDDVVSSMLNEMLAGYNCTIFAYGQTGTGKTYTMTGDMKDNHGTFSEAAGIIPRSLHNLFTSLDASGSEYTVKCSFLELYNEELRDLLSTEESTKVKIFDDSNKKGSIIIQNMEESFIKTAEEGSKLLALGSYKRQVAATKCNDLSSRSHTVFTITVHVKEPGEDGEDILRTGKLNLVDLAGSENIGRSGAENKRAREAGMINQSLLTLGRVINALVDKASHIPYRESKLTRLLQDSLGGRTKTCIIATVSPAKVNLEETMSTLDYATRAKNIRNKPQLNQLMTKKALLTEYANEIERLKADLAATRQKNGVFINEDSFKQMNEESESQKYRIEEQERKIEVLNIRYDKVNEEFRAKTKLFEETKKSLNETKEMLSDTKGSLAQAEENLDKTEKTLSATKQSLNEETIVRRAHEKAEGKLEAIGQDLIKTLGLTVSDVTELQEKIRRKEDLDATNKNVLCKTQHEVHDVTESVESKISDFADQHFRLTDSLSTRISEFIQTEVRKLTGTYQSVQDSFDRFGEKEGDLLVGTEKNKNDMNEVLEEIKTLREEVKSRVGEGLKGLNDAAERIAGEVVADMIAFQQTLHASYSHLGREFKVMFDNTQKHLAAQKAEAEKLRLELAVATSNAITSSSAASLELERVLAEEKEKNDAERQSLLTQIAALVNTTADEQEKRLGKRINQIRGDIDASKQELSEASTDYTQRMADWSASEESFLQELIVSRESLKTKLVQDWHEAEEYSSNIQATTQAIHAQTVKLVDEQIQEVDVQMKSLDEFVTRARNENEAHHTRFTSTFQGLSDSTKDSYTELWKKLEHMRADLNEFDMEMNINVGEIKSSIEPFSKAAQKALQDLRYQVDEAQFEDYTPTGRSPKRRKYDYPETLPQTKTREEILEEAKREKEKERHGRFGFNPATRKQAGIDTEMLEEVEVNISGDSEELASKEEQGGNMGHDGDLLSSPFETLSPVARSAISSRAITPVYQEAPLVNSSINTHTFTQQGGRRQFSGSSTKSTSSVKSTGLKELNPNVDVGTYRASTASAASSQEGNVPTKDTEQITASDMQPPLKKEKLVGVVVEKKRYGGKVSGENGFPATRKRAARNAS
ncbi:P-loop containing nucleoside triphosphate hydrolase protein [Kalaharituber pfeilii]|nr:P-loop containing nucleoside triphosphate hydrolase protein [Kalaharituber pfeilii]